MLAIVTEQNLPARRAVQHVAHQRRTVADAGEYHQKIALIAWEHDTFQQRVGSMLDRRCGGTGWGNLYQRAVTDHATIVMSHNGDPLGTAGNNSNRSSSWVADTLLLSCLLTSGYADGWIHRTVKPVASLTRGLQGVAAVRMGTRTKRIHSDLLWLPILTREQRRQQQQQSKHAVSPSTTLPLKIPQYWLAQTPNDINELEDIVQKWEEFLYEVIAQEQAVDSSRWVLLNAACRHSERNALAPTQKLVATTCLDENINGSKTEEECCSFYDPNLEPLLPRQERQPQDDGD